MLGEWPFRFTLIPAFCSRCVPLFPFLPLLHHPHINKILHLGCEFLAAAAVLFGSPAAASHLQGGELTYASLGNNRYRMMCRLYRECSVVVSSPPVLQGRAGGCNTPLGFTVPMLEEATDTTGHQYCASAPNRCTGSGSVNLEVHTCAAEVVQVPAPRLTLSVTECCQQTVRLLRQAGQ